MIIFSKAGEYDKIVLYSKLTHNFLSRGYKVLNFIYNLAEKKSYKKFKINGFDVFKSKEKKDTIEDYLEKNIDEILKFEKLTRKNIDLEKFKKYIEEYWSLLVNLNQKEKFEICILWNNTFLYDRILYFFCKKNNIKYFVLEEGYFRPFTLTLDSKGVNKEANIPRNKEFYSELEIDLQRMKKYLLSPEYVEIKKNLFGYRKYKFYRLIDKITAPFLNSKNISDLNLKGDLANQLKIMKNKRIKIEKKIKEEYIFIPFQVETDSQIVLNSPKIKRMIELFKIVSEAVEKYNRKNNKAIKAIFKTHPMDPVLNIKEILEVKKNYKNSILITIGNTKELIKNSKIVITINSTVGIEALCEYKPVITLGEAFYNIDEIAYHINEYEKLEETIKLALNKKINQELIGKFLYYLRFSYFKEIHWRNPDNNSIERIANEILEVKES